MQRLGAQIATSYLLPQVGEGGQQVDEGEGGLLTIHRVETFARRVAPVELGWCLSVSSTRRLQSSKGCWPATVGLVCLVSLNRGVASRYSVRLPPSSSDQRPRLRVAHDIHVDATTFATSGHLRPRRVASTLVPANRRWLSRITGGCISNMGASSNHAVRWPASGQLQPARCQTGNDQPSSVSRMATRLASRWQVAAPMAGAVATSIATACRSRCPTVSRRSQAGLDRARAENVR